MSPHRLLSRRLSQFAASVMKCGTCTHHSETHRARRYDKLTEPEKPFRDPTRWSGAPVGSWGEKIFMAKYAANKRYLYEIWKTCYLCCTFDLAGRHCGARCHCPDRHPGIPNAAGRISVLAHPRGRFFSSYYSLIFCIPYNAFRTIYEAPYMYVCVCC